MSCCKQVNKIDYIKEIIKECNKIVELKGFCLVLQRYNGKNADELYDLLCLQRWYIYTNYDISSIKIRDYITICDDIIKFITC